MKNRLKRILDRLRAATTGRLRKPTSVREGGQQPQRMQSVLARPQP